MKTPTFYKAKLTKLSNDDVMELTKGLSIEERMGNSEGKCPECGKNDWWLFPDECVGVKEGGKPYMECLNCGHITHL